MPEEKEPTKEELFKTLLESAGYSKFFGVAMTKSGDLSVVKVNLNSLEEYGMGQFIYRVTTVDIIERLQRSREERLRQLIVKEANGNIEVDMSKLDPTSGE